MRISIISILFIILSLQLTACNNNKDIPSRVIINQSLRDAVEGVDEILIDYGDGNQITLNESVSIRKILGYLKAMSYEEVGLPDTVGQSFTLKLSREKELYYMSSGYLKINETLYKASNADIVAELNDYIVNYGLEEIPGLLGRG
jgi:hypothetical protein